MEEIKRDLVDSTATEVPDSLSVEPTTEESRLSSPRRGYRPSLSERNAFRDDLEQPLRLQRRAKTNYHGGHYQSGIYRSPKESNFRIVPRRDKEQISQAILRRLSTEEG